MCIMAHQLLLVALACFAGLAAAQTYQAYPTHLYPLEHRAYSAYRGIRPIAELPSTGAYELQVVPASTVAEYDIGTDLSIWDYIPNPITALSCVASKALSVAKWTLAKAPLIILGMALVIGFCAFTPYCTLVIEKPFAREIRSLNIPYLDDVEHYVKEAYQKYRAMQD
ncbi:uncharacterized protein LOC125238429 [Leguminivora glycinivorella]|uniref:uncharacterized protein LOC125238429 n=1 Tax=Leguminivora glycinivorella TaxID=1035111 RepID=UPI00200EC727|nr:uncharacterized protein LOC125238429 [Leguminivora glycinivorella]